MPVLLNTLIPFSSAPDAELFAIGDIHGHLDLLQRALDGIRATPRADGRRRILIFLGDLIDRGPNSFGCMDAAMSADTRFLTRADEVVWIMGNHEQMLATALASEADLAAVGLGGEPSIRNNALGCWLMNGGGRVLSERLADRELLDDPADIFGERRLAWLRSLKTAYVSGRIAFIHAGLPPGQTLAGVLAAPAFVDIEALDEDDHFAWVRDPFLCAHPGSSKGHDGFFVVHGHTPPMYEPIPAPEAQVPCGRINLDGGSYKTGRARFARIVDNGLTVHEV